jgi:glycine cleavage system aminomethyltransferase T
MRLAHGQARWGIDLAHGSVESIERLRLCELAADAPIPAGLEPILAGDRLIGLTTSGAYDPQHGRVVAIASFDPGDPPDGDQHILINDRRHAIRPVAQRIEPVAR